MFPPVSPAARKFRRSDDQLGIGVLAAFRRGGDVVNRDRALTAVFERHEFGAPRKCGSGIGRALNAQAGAEMAQSQNFRR
jgi:hypothetical protein